MQGHQIPVKIVPIHKYHVLTVGSELKTKDLQAAIDALAEDGWLLGLVLPAPGPGEPHRIIMAKEVGSRMIQIEEPRIATFPGASRN